MSARKQLKELEQRVAREPQNLALRLRLAAALRAIGRRAEGTDLVRSVAVAYQAEGRLVQALAVCRSLLELEPADLPTLGLHADLEAARTGAPGEEPTQWGYAGGTGQTAAAGSAPRPAPVPPAPALARVPVPEVEVGPDEYQVDESETRDPARTRPRPGSGGPAGSDDDQDRLDTARTPLAEIVDQSPAGLPFALLPPDAQRALVARRLARRFAPGDIIVREGEPGESCFVVVSGQVLVLRRDPDRPGATVEAARMGPGELFGEFALLADRRRHATVQALDVVEAFEIPRKVLRELAAAHPAVAAGLDRLYRERLVENLVQRSPFFRLLPVDHRLTLASRFTFHRFEAGNAVVREGAPAGGFFLVVLGSVEITRRVGGRGAVLLATLREGHYFGEMSLLAGTVASATVTATGPTELAQLPRRDFYDVVSAHPALWEELRREARRRELATENILAGETSVV